MTRRAGCFHGEVHHQWRTSRSFVCSLLFCCVFGCSPAGAQLQPVLEPWTPGPSVSNGLYPAAVSLGRYAVVIGGATGLPPAQGSIGLPDFCARYATTIISCYDTFREELVLPRVPPAMTPAPTAAPNTTIQPSTAAAVTTDAPSVVPPTTTAAPDNATTEKPSPPPPVFDHWRGDTAFATLDSPALGSFSTAVVGNTLWTLGMCTMVPNGVTVNSSDPMTRAILLSVQATTVYETVLSSQDMEASTVYMNTTSFQLSSNTFVFNASCVAQDTKIYVVGGIDATTGEVISSISQFDTVTGGFAPLLFSFVKLNNPVVAADDSFIYALDSQLDASMSFTLSMRHNRGYILKKWTATPDAAACVGPPSMHIVNGSIFVTCPPYSLIMEADVLRNLTGWPIAQFGGSPDFQAAAFLAINRPTNVTMLLFGGGSRTALSRIILRSVLSNISLFGPQLFGFYFHAPTPAPTPLPSTAAPSTLAPTTAIPSTAVPSTSEPSTAVPSTAHPSTAAPTTDVPSTAEPSTAEPSTAEPSTGQPSTAHPTTTEPSTEHPTTAKPLTEHPSTSAVPETSAAPATTAAPDTTTVPESPPPSFLVRPFIAQDSSTTLAPQGTTPRPTNATATPPTLFPPAVVPNSFNNITYRVNGYLPLWYNYSFDLLFLRNDRIFLDVCQADGPLAVCAIRLSPSPRCDVSFMDVDLVAGVYTLLNPEIVSVTGFQVTGPGDSGGGDSSSSDTPNGYEPEEFVYVCFSSGLLLLQQPPCTMLNCPAQAFVAINQNYPFILSPIITAPAPAPTPQPPATPTPTKPQPASPSSNRGTIVLVSAGGGCAFVILVILVLALRAKRLRRDEERGLLEDDVPGAYQQGLLDGKYRVIQRLGKGSFSVVYLVERVTDRRRFALKYVQCADDTDRVEAMKECEVVHKLQGHPGVILLEDMFMSYKFDTNLTNETDNSPKRFDTTLFVAQEERSDSVLSDPRKKPAGERYLSLVMEYHEKGDLGRWVRQQKMLQKVPEPTIVSIAYQVLSVLHYMHNRSPPIVHRDLKPENILLSSVVYENVSSAFVPIVVTDFGLSRVMDKTFCETGVGSLPYVAPETWQRNYSVKIDIWAIGCIMYAMATRRCEPENVKVMFSESGRSDFKKMIYNDIHQHLGYSDGLASFIVSLLEPDKDLRPTAMQCLSRIQRRMGRDGKGKVFSSLSGTNITSGSLDSALFNRDAQCEYFLPSESPMSSPREQQQQQLLASAREGSRLSSAIPSEKSISVQFDDEDHEKDEEVSTAFQEQPVQRMDPEKGIVKERDFSLEEEVAASMKTISRAEEETSDKKL